MNKSTMFLTYAVCLVLSVSFSSMAVTYHVAKTGNDDNAGSQASPYLTISKAALSAQSGDSVIVHTGTYREWVQPARGGTSATSRITYKAATGEQVVIKGSEQITTWQALDSGMWKVDLPDSYFAQFGNWYPFQDTIAGRYVEQDGSISAGSWCHLGDVYLDEILYIEVKTMAALKTKVGTWYTSRSGTTQSICANFGAANPNTQLAEINVRQAVFGKDVEDGINYLTIDGFTIMQSAEEWYPTYHKLHSRGALFVSGSNWTIQNCTVKFAKMRGICFDSPPAGTLIVRNNIVEDCGVIGIAGANADGSVISGNWIRNIHGLRAYYGPEQAGIKVHTSRNLILSGNIISNVTSPSFGQGIWLDYANGNSRITGNVIMNISDNGIYLENPSGPNLIDNNIVICAAATLEDANILVNNLFVNVPMAIAPGGWGNTHGIYNKSFNNIYMYSSSGMPAKTGNQSDYNAFLNGGNKSQVDTHSITDNTPTGFEVLTVDTVKRSVTIAYNLPDNAINVTCPIITTQSIDSQKCQKSFFTMKNQDGTPFAVDRDFFQVCRGTSTKVGPFVNLHSGRNIYTLRPNSDFAYTAKCVSATTQQPLPSATKASTQPSMPDVNDRVIVAYELNPESERSFNPQYKKISFFWKTWNTSGNTLDYAFMDPVVLNGWHALFPNGNNGTSDASVTIRMAWGEKGLYILFLVTDDHFVDMTDSSHAPAGDMCEFYLESHSTADIATGNYWKPMQSMGARVSVPDGCTQDMVQYQQGIGNHSFVQWLNRVAWSDSAKEIKGTLLNTNDAAARGIVTKNVIVSKNQRAQEWFISWSNVGRNGMKKPKMGQKSAFDFIYDDIDQAKQQGTDLLIWNRRSPYTAQSVDDWNDIEYGPSLNKQLPVGVK